MDIKKINLVYFSPTGSTKKILKNIVKNIDIEIVEINLTNFEARWGKYEFGEDELVIFGMPVYGGRLPAISNEFFRGLSGSNTPAACVVSYGNRDYDDALIELKDLSTKSGFLSIAGAAFVSKHAIVHGIATNRSDSQDELSHYDFGEKLMKKIADALSSQQIDTIEVRGRNPYKSAFGMPFGPSTKEICDECKSCADNCPVRAINPDDPKEVDELRCINCFSCVNSCKKEAKYIDSEEFKDSMKMLEKICEGRRETEIFI